jgi:uncharacterized protein involved in exopolysaccharide biosynthesis
MIEKKKMKFLDYWIIIMKHRRILVTNTSLVTLLAVIISLLLIYKYTATATVLPPSSDQTSLLGLFAPNISSGLSGLSRMSGLMPGLATPSDLYAAIMQSGKIKGEIIDKYDLMSEFKAKTKTDASKALDEITKIEVSPEGIISVAVTYKNKYLAADIANSYVEELDRFNTETAMTVGKKYRIFIEERLEDNMDSLVMAEETLRTFQEKHRTVALDIEIESAIAAIAELKSQIILLDVKRGALTSSSQRGNPYLYDINKELRELKKQLSKIEMGSKTQDKNGFGAGWSIPFAELPELSLEFARLLRDVKVQEAIYELLTQQYEQAKIMELKDTPTVQFLDRASPPEKRSFPKRTLIVLFALFVSIVFNIPFAFVLEYLSDIRAHPVHHQTFIKVSGDISDDIKKAISFLKSRLRKANKK